MGADFALEFDVFTFARCKRGMFEWIAFKGVYIFYVAVIEVYEFTNL